MSAQVISNFILAATLIVAVIAFMADHNHRRKIATYRYYDQISGEITIKLRNVIRKVYKDPVLKHTDTKIYPKSRKWKKNKDLQLLALTYCRKMNRFSIGIENRIYDFKTFYKFSGKATVLLHDKIKPIIKEYDNNNEYSLCKNFDILCERLEAKHFKEMKKKRRLLKFFKIDDE